MTDHDDGGVFSALSTEQLAAKIAHDITQYSPTDTQVKLSLLFSHKCASAL